MAGKTSSQSKSATRSGTSPVRIVLSAMVLGFVVGLLSVEAIAALGYSRTIGNFKQHSTNGDFSDVSFADMEDLVKYSAAIDTMGVGKHGTEYRYRWFSLFRNDLFVYVIASPDTPPQALLWATDPARPEKDDRKSPSSGL